MDPLLQAMQSWGKPSTTAPEKKDPTQYELPYTLTEEKTSEEIRKLRIDNGLRLRNIVEKSMVQAVMKEIGHQIQTNFVDMARRDAPEVAALLGVPEKERDLERIWADKNASAILSVIDNIERLAMDGTWE